MDDSLLSRASGIDPVTFLLAPGSQCSFINSRKSAQSNKGCPEPPAPPRPGCLGFGLCRGQHEGSGRL